MKILLLHGNLDIWIYEAKNVPHRHLYVSVRVAGATVGRTYVISSINNEGNPVWMQHLNVPVAHYDAQVEFVLKDNDVVGSQLIASVGIPVEQIYGGEIAEGFFPILGNDGKPCKAGSALRVAIKYIPIENLSIYHCGVGAGPEYNGVPGTYFPLRKGGTVTLYQDAHVPDGYLPNVKLEYDIQYGHGKCWHDIFDAILQARRLIYIAGWSVWHKVRLVRDDNSLAAHSLSLGELLKAKSQEGVRVLLLLWDDPTSIRILGRTLEGFMQTHDEETRRFFKHSAVQVLLSPRVPGKVRLYTNNEKTVIVDANAGKNRRKIISFLGGLDLCDGRYDTPQHPIFGTLQTTHVDDYHNPTYAVQTI